MSLALLLTITSNIIGIFTMPFVLPHIVAASSLDLGAAGAAAAGAQMLEPLPLMFQLCQTILVPTAIGASIRAFVPGGFVAIALHTMYSYCVCVCVCARARVCVCVCAFACASASMSVCLCARVCAAHECAQMH